MCSHTVCGRKVHVSNKTLEKLGDTFQVEPALAEKREPFLRRAGLTTYFIVKPASLPVRSRREQWDGVADHGRLGQRHAQTRTDTCTD